MKIKRSLLLEALKAVQPGLAAKELVAQSESFVFADGRVFTYNDEIAVSHPIDIDLEGAVPAKAFYALINKVKTDEISLDIKGGELLLAGSKAKAGLRIETEVILPLEQLGMPTDWIELPETFCTAVQACLFSASTNEQQAILTCIHIIESFVESCDNHRITQYNMGKDSELSFPEELLIPAVAAKDIITHEPVEYALTEGWIHFRNEKDVTFSCRYFMGEYPDYTPFLDVEGCGAELPTTLPEVLDRAGVMGDGERVSLILDNNELIVTTENESGWFEESIDIAYKGDAIEFDIQPEFMKAILKLNGVVTIGDGAIRFDSENFIHVVKILAPKPKK
jgi:DNA polymerase III sliding clamp (beta) subunit (PCNA family)